MVFRKSESHFFIRKLAPKRTLKIVTLDVSNHGMIQGDGVAETLSVHFAINGRKYKREVLLRHAGSVVRQQGLRLSDAERSTLAEIAQQLGR